jgi:hypothetical protein
VKIKSAVALGAAAMVMTSGVALGAVTFDADGFGYVGLGDVKNAYGWKTNSTAQTKGASITFEADRVVTRTQDCATTGGGPPVFVGAQETTTQTVSKENSYDQKNPKAKQLNGWNLLGFDGVLEISDSVLSCPAGSQPIGDVTVSISNTLYADHPTDGRRALATS